jgi:hypothetical protein
MELTIAATIPRHPITCETETEFVRRHINSDEGWNAGLDAFEDQWNGRELGWSATREEIIAGVNNLLDVLRTPGENEKQAKDCFAADVEASLVTVSRRSPRNRC